MKTVWNYIGAGTALLGALIALANSLPSATAADKLVIGFSQGTMNHPWRVAMVDGNKKYATEHYPDVDLVVTDGQNQATKQVSDVESLISRGIKVLVISPLQAQALTPIVKQAMEANIPVVTLDRAVNTKVTCQVGAQNKPIGVEAGKFIAEKLNGKGNVIEVQGTAGASATIDRHDGFREALKDSPGIKVVADQFCDYLREPAVKFVEDMLQRFGPGQLQAIYAHNDEMALGAIKAVEAAGRSKEIVIIGIDGQGTAPSKR
jgi:ribose transport system substrate-binding protein